MIEWLGNNYGNIIVVIILAVVIGGAVYKIISNKKKGKCNCGCDGSCAGCKENKL